VTTVVLDASVIVKWIFADRAEELHSLQILQFVKESRVSVVQPPHWLAEAAAIIVRLDPGRARQAVSLLHALEFPVVTGVEVYHKACDLSASLKQHLFDTFLRQGLAVYPLFGDESQICECGGIDERY
jgi:predicted nucleic acid-binding protein